MAIGENKPISGLDPGRIPMGDHPVPADNVQAGRTYKHELQVLQAYAESAFQWSGFQTYSIGNIRYDKGIAYRSLQNANSGKVPATSPTFWAVENSAVASVALMFWTPGVYARYEVIAVAPTPTGYGIFRLTTGIRPFKSTDFAAELLAGDWVQIGGDVDLSNYYTKAEVNALIQNSGGGAGGFSVTNAVINSGVLNLNEAGDIIIHTVANETTVNSITNIAQHYPRVMEVVGNYALTFTPSASIQVNGVDPGTGMRLVRLYSPDGTRMVVDWRPKEGGATPAELGRAYPAGTFVSYQRALYFARIGHTLEGTVLADAMAYAVNQAGNFDYVSSYDYPEEIILDDINSTATADGIKCYHFIVDVFGWDGSRSFDIENPCNRNASYYVQVRKHGDAKDLPFTWGSAFLDTPVLNDDNENEVFHFYPDAAGGLRLVSRSRAGTGGGTPETAATIKAKLESLAGEDRLDASAIKNLPSGSATPQLTQAQREAIIDPSIGLEVYQTDGQEGPWIYTSQGWLYLPGNKFQTMVQFPNVNVYQEMASKGFTLTAATKSSNIDSFTLKKNGVTIALPNTFAIGAELQIDIVYVSGKTNGGITLDGYFS